MEKKGKWRAVALWLLIVFCLAYTLPTFAGKDSLPKWFSDIFSAELDYGLDLQGGLELRYTVDWKKAIEDNARKLGESIRAELVDELAKADNKSGSDLPADEWDAYAKNLKIEIPDYTTIRVIFANAEVAGVLDRDRLVRLDARFDLIDIDDVSYDLMLKESEAARIRNNVVKETRSIIQKRVEAFGLVDPDVRIAGEADIAVQIPGVGKAQMETVRQRIGQTAQLTFRMVDEESTFFIDREAELNAWIAERPNSTLKLVKASATGPYVRGARKSELIKFMRSIDIPDDHSVGYEEILTTEGNITTDRFWRSQYLLSKVELSGGELSRAQVFYDEKGVPYVSLDFNAEGGRIFADLTGRNVGKYMAIMLDETVNSAPVIKEKIGGGRARITMGGGRAPQQVLDDARSLVTVLNHGAYKAPVYKVHDYEVGPSLGADSVAAGKLSIAVGFGLVVFFMLLYYRASGIVAVTALLLNMLFILTLLVSFNSALTLPGMAGIILTIGMAVDANIIIFERIREELLNGRSPRAAVDAGFEKAWSTILDANVTTALAGLILLYYTSGTIRGFAVTLLMGIVSSVFTAVYVSRRIFNWYLTSRRPSELSI